MPHPRYPALLSPVRIGRRTLPNRVVMGSMHLGLEETPGGFERMAAFYAERVRGGVGLIVTGGVSPNAEGRLTEHGAVLGGPMSTGTNTIADTGGVANTGTGTNAGTGTGTGAANDGGGSGTTAAGTASTDTETLLAQHRLITDAVHAEGGLILLQLLHAGRYAAHPDLVAPSALQAPINRFAPRELSDAEVRRTIDDYARAARLAVSAGYDGVEIMGSEGYLINEFLAEATNRRDDAWGGDPERRRAFPLAVTEAVRAALDEAAAGATESGIAEAETAESGDAAVDRGAPERPSVDGPHRPLLSYRVSLADLVPGGSTLDEHLELAAGLEQRGVDLFITGIGWHEARIPTIATSVPRASFAPFSRALAERVSVPVAAANRINTPETAERLLADGAAELVSLARPLLADPDFVRKAELDDARAVNTCIACNQACLDHVFAGRLASCLVNPRAGRETELVLTPVGGNSLKSTTATAATTATTATETTAATPASSPALATAPPRKRVAVIGAGPAGLAAATAAAERGHEVELFEQRDAIGGQFDLARRIPGKEEFAETLRYFETTLERLGVRLRLGRRADAATIAAEGFDEVILASGVAPRVPEIPGIELPHVADYAAVLRGEHEVGGRVAILGAGGIGFDVAEFLARDAAEPPLDAAGFAREWGVSTDPALPGALARPVFEPSPRTITMLQRKTSRPGATLGLTTGWIHRAEVQRRGVEAIAGVAYDEIVPEGIRITVGGESRFIAADTIVLCTGQESVNALSTELERFGIAPRTIGGALLAGELDAKRAIRQGVETAAAL